MSYFKTKTSIVTKKEKNLLNFIKKRSLIGPYKPSSSNEYNEYFNKNKFKSIDSNKTTIQDRLNKITPEQLAAVRKLLYICVKLAVGNWINKFVDTKLNELTISTINKHKGNKKLYEHIVKDIEKVAKSNPSFTKCSPEQFKETSIWNYFLSEWRGLTAKQFIKRVGYEYIDQMISLIAADLVPLPGSNILLTTPCKMMMTYLGINLGVGAVYHIVVDIEGYTVSMGISFTKLGFIISDMRLYLFRQPGNKLVVKELPDPPRELYEIDLKEAKDILDKYGEDEDLEKLKTKVSEINGNN